MVQVWNIFRKGLTVKLKKKQGPLESIQTVTKYKQTDF